MLNVEVEGLLLAPIVRSELNNLFASYLVLQNEVMLAGRIHPLVETLHVDLLLIIPHWEFVFELQKFHTP